MIWRGYDPVVFIFKTRMHSSRMRTGCSYTVCWSQLPGGGGAGLPGPGGCLIRGGLPGLGGMVSYPGEGLVSQHALRQNPPCEQNDKQV